MDKQIENPVTRELRSVIRFLNVNNTKSADIHRQICEVYGENATSDSTVRRRVRPLKNRVAQYRISDEACLAAVFSSTTTPPPTHGECNATSYGF